MPPLYVNQQGAKLRIENNRLQVVANPDSPTLESEILVSLPLAHVSQVVLFGNISITTPAIDRLLAQGVEVIFLTRQGEYRGRLEGGLMPHVPLRRQQYQRLAQPEFTLAMARAFVNAKLAHQKTLLQRHNRDQSDPDIDHCIEQLNDAQQLLAHRHQLSSLRGLEGSATAAYFRGFKRLFDPAWKFDDRNRRPPRDPVNVLLSLGYTLITRIAASAVEATGLDPYAGFLHEIAYNRPALGLDLVEEFRPVVDGVVLWCCRSGQLTPADFGPGPAERPVQLDDDGKRRFLKAFEERMEQRLTHPRRGLQFPLRQCLLEQARQIVDCVQSGKPDYRGMGFR